MNLYKSYFGQEVSSIEELPQSGSYRRYFRLTDSCNYAIGVYNEDYKENRAFVEFSKHFYDNDISVPRIYAEDLKNSVYLQEDLGRDCLLDFIERDDNQFSESLVNLYKKVIEKLVEIQIKGAYGLDYSLCIPRDTFDSQSIAWDLNYYKYCWCRLAKIPFDEQKLENDFNKLIDFLISERHDFFLYRDFQSRNIMLKGGEPFFIDYQGGRKGALQYDIASLLFDAIANIPNEIREKLFEYYMDVVSTYIFIDRDDFKSKYYAYALVRLLQAMGAFGLRGLHENKQHFIDSIEPGMLNLKYIVSDLKKTINLPELYKTINNY